MPVQSVKLNSSWLDGATYDDQAQVLTVTTKSGTTHEHHVSPQVFNEMVASPSAGQYYNAKLRKRS